MDKSINKRINIHIGKFYFSAYLLGIFSFYVDKISRYEVEKKVEKYKKKGLKHQEKILYIKAVRELTSWGIKQSQLWVELNFPELPPFDSNKKEK